MPSPAPPITIVCATRRGGIVAGICGGVGYGWAMRDLKNVAASASRRYCRLPRLPVQIEPVRPAGKRYAAVRDHVVLMEGRSTRRGTGRCLSEEAQCEDAWASR